ncbi:hypothetical protein CF028_03275 [Klebsiella pneumoniae]|nr:hypothetical protein AM455_03195 [Klebsiella pneumoniae]OYG36921.1 hypothetical protein CI648_04295 [Klebsiella pneumoniae subsp. pneumoniae]AYJ92479.1 hypothetical protein D9K64_03905 [Klebsiella pneumoniae]EIW8480631.1 hypothetical protein [Klebsiella pneumoniae]MBA0103831.1 hypothetical protein [Klebsiella pneumoniae]
MTWSCFDSCRYIWHCIYHWLEQYMKRHTAAHRASTQLLRRYCRWFVANARKNGGRFTELKSQRRWRRIAQQKGPECEIPHLTR